MATDFEDNLYHEKLPNICSAVSNKARKCCSLDTVKEFLPFLKWLHKYEAQFIIQDFVAGLTVGLTAIPQSIAYGTVAGLPPQYGLYSAFMGCFMYIIFGTCKDITVGPTAILALMVQMHMSKSVDYVVLSTFLIGCIIILMGVLNLGVLVQFISVPVTIGFTSAAAMTIGSGQINNLFGIKSPSNEFIASWKNFFTHLNETSRNDAILGVSMLVMLILMKKVNDIPFRYKVVTKYISLSRNALAVIVGILLCYLLSDGDYLPFKVSGQITPGVPPFRLPPFSTEIDGEKISFGEMMSELGVSIATISLIAVLESVAIAKAFSKGKIVNASQEMIALGMCNMMGSFFSSMPVTGSFTRTALNHASGVRTPLGGAITGTLVLMALAFLTKTFYYIPKASLAAIIIAAMIYMVEYDKIIEIWRSKKIDFIPFLVTILCCLFWSLEYGILVGAFINLLFILHSSARPKIVLTQEKYYDFEIVNVEVQENIGYSAAEYLKAKIIKFVAIQPEGTISYVILRGEEIHTIDSTVGLNILSIREDLRMLKCELICLNWNIAAAGVVCRLHHDARKMFRFGSTLDDVLKHELNNVNETTIVEVPE